MIPKKQLEKEIKEEKLRRLKGGLAKEPLGILGATLTQTNEIIKLIEDTWKGQTRHKKCYIVEKEGHKICLKCEIERFRKQLLIKIKGDGE